MSEFTIPQSSVMDDTITITGSTMTSGYTYANSTITSCPSTSWTYNTATTATTAISGSVTINPIGSMAGAVGTSVGINGTWGNVSIPKPTMTLEIDDTGQAIIKTPTNKINVDELAEFVIMLKSLLVAVASDEEFAKRNPAIAEMAHDLLIKKLKG